MRPYKKIGYVDQVSKNEKRYTHPKGIPSHKLEGGERLMGFYYAVKYDNGHKNDNQGFKDMGKYGMPLHECNFFSGNKTKYIVPREDKDYKQCEEKIDSFKLILCLYEMNNAHIPQKEKEENPKQMFQKNREDYAIIPQGNTKKDGYLK